MSLKLHMQIFNKKSHQARAQECLKQKFPHLLQYKNLYLG